MMSLEISSQPFVVLIDKKNHTCDMETNKQGKIFIFYIEISMKEGD
jgi:hypothetical protein